MAAVHDGVSLAPLIVQPWTRHRSATTSLSTAPQKLSTGCVTETISRCRMPEWIASVLSAPLYRSWRRGSRVGQTPLDQPLKDLRGAVLSLCMN